MGRGQVVIVLVFYSNDPSSNPADVLNFDCAKIALKTKEAKKRQGVVHLIKQNVEEMDILKAKSLMSCVKRGHIPRAYIFHVLYANDIHIPR